MKALTGLFLVRSWIGRTAAAHAKEAKSVTEVIEALGFRRLPLYFDAAFLDRVRCVTVDRVPLPPLVSSGLSYFAGIRSTDYAGIAYGDTYFVDRRYGQSESLHFHELVHALQWDCLGFDRFVRTYVAGVLRKGYARSPLEAMACEHQRRFETAAAAYPVGAAVRSELQAARLKPFSPGP